MRRARSQARSLYGRQSLPKREGLLSARTLASNVGSAGLRPLRPHHDSANFRTFYHRRPPAVVETPCTIQAIQKTLTRRGDPRETDTQDLEAFFRRPSTGILQLPTYAGANLRADRTLASTSKFSLPMQSHVQRAIFRALVTEAQRALSTRGRVGSAVWAASVDEGYTTRRVIHKAGGGEVGKQSSISLDCLDRLLLHCWPGRRRLLSGQ